MNYGMFDNGWYWVEWEDFFFKFSYFFVLVGGDFGCVEDEFIIWFGWMVVFCIYVEFGDELWCMYVFDVLKWFMRWDEVKYGCEYDFDIFMIVVVSYFNMGVMENKGFNIFNF